MYIDLELKLQQNISNSLISDTDSTSNSNAKISIKPYFSNAVSEREKSYLTFSIADIIEETHLSRKANYKIEEATGLKDPEMMKEFKIQKGKDKKKTQMKQKVETITENIKRELPNEM